MANIIEIKWLAAPEEHDYPVAEFCLNLIYDAPTAASLARQLQQVPMTSFKAKDIFRASGLSLLGVSNLHVEKDRKKILAGHAL